MLELANPVTVKPFELQEGDKVMAVVVTCHVIKRGGKCYYKLYRCGYPPEEYGGVPQGSRIGGDEDAIVEQLFPVVTWSDIVGPDVF